MKRRNSKEHIFEPSLPSNRIPIMVASVITLVVIWMYMRTWDYHEEIRAETDSLISEAPIFLPKKVDIPTFEIPMEGPPTLPEGYKEKKENILGHDITIYDDQSSFGIDHIIEEFQKDVYGLQALTIKPGDIILDIGGNVGMFSLMFAKLHPQAKIYTFEPIPRNYQFLRYNLFINGISSVTTVNRGLSSDGRSFTVKWDGRNPGGAGLLEQSTSGLTIEIKTVTIEQIMHKWDIQKVEYMKIDCEGCEHEVMPLLDLTKFKRIRGEAHDYAKMPPGVPRENRDKFLCLMNAMKIQAGYGEFMCDPPGLR